MFYDKNTDTCRMKSSRLPYTVLIPQACKEYITRIIVITAANKYWYLF